jgi:hypothetical protein
MNGELEQIEKPELKIFDDSYYLAYRENNNYIGKENLFDAIIADFFVCIQEVNFTGELRIGYMLYSKLSLSSSKMNTILNLLVLQKNPNIRVQSHWDVVSTFKGPMQTANGLEIVDVDKIRIKLIIKTNDKDLSIKKLAEINLNNLKKNTKKINEYLTK